jgi:hypothetical protein
MTTNATELSPRDITTEFFSNKNFPGLGDIVENNEEFKSKRINCPAPKRKNSRMITIGQYSINNMENDNSVYNKTFKTKLCSSFKNNKSCFYGKNCKYAHSYDELNIKKCLFSENCNKITINEEGKILNKNDNNICKFIHNNETKEDYINRLDQYNFDNKSYDSDLCEKVYPDFDKNIYFCNSIFPSEFVNIPIDIDYNPYKVNHIKIPKALAKKALNLALNSGIKDIRIEII